MNEQQGDMLVDVSKMVYEMYKGLPFQMSLRDWFATFAMHALVNSLDTVEFRDAAQEGYQIADLMLKAREEKK